MQVGPGAKESYPEEKEAFMKMGRKTTSVTRTGNTPCPWSSAVLCWPDQEFRVSRSTTLST